MAEHGRHVAGRVGTRRCEEIRVADAARLEPDEHFAGARFCKLDLLHLERAAELLEHGCAHLHAAHSAEVKSACHCAGGFTDPRPGDARSVRTDNGSGRVAVFDAMGTLFDVGSLDTRFVKLGGTSAVRRQWFARLLQTAHALTMIGDYRSFAELAQTTLRSTLAQEDLDVSAAHDLASALSEVDAYPDARDALTKLADESIPAVILTNGGRRQTQSLLSRAGLSEAIAQVFSTDDVRAYKPDVRPYQFVAEQLALPPEQLTLIAAHGWDVLGARNAGLDAIWVERLEREWPFPIDAPDQPARDLIEAAERVAAAARVAPSSEAA
jgi:2-haloacid dehalogenase